MVGKLSLEELQRLLELLNIQRVTSFECDGLKVTLIPSGPIPPPEKPAASGEIDDETLYWSAGQ
jgi:hypothetical protein